MDFLRHLNRSHFWLTAALALALTSTTQVSAQDAPRVEPDQITIAAEAGKVSFSMFGSDVGFFREIRFVNDDEGSKIEGIIVAMGRARGERRNASIRTSGATPGIYFVELVDSRGNAVTLDLEVIVEGDEEVEELSAPEISKDLIEIPADAGRVSFSMFGPDVGLFMEIQAVPDDDRADTEGIRIAMGRARGEKRNASIRTSGATPGLYFVELHDGRGDAVTLDLEVIVEEMEEPEVVENEPEPVQVEQEEPEPDQGEQQSGDAGSAPQGPASLQILGFMDELIPGLMSVELGGVTISIEETTQGDQPEFRTYTYGSAEYSDIVLTIMSGPATVALADWFDDTQRSGGTGDALRRDAILTFGDQSGEPGVQFAAQGCLPVALESTDSRLERHRLTLRPQRIEQTMSAEIGVGSFTLDTSTVRGLRVEIDVDGTVVELINVMTAGGMPEAEMVEASSSSSQQSESTMGHAYVTDLELEVPVGHDSGILSQLMHAVVNQGQDVSAAIRITVEARDGSLEQESLYETCRLRSLNLGSFNMMNSQSVPMLKAVFVPQRLVVQ